jgi:hypothetical protein
VFSALIGGPGHYTLHPDGRFVWGGAYEPGGLIWRSRWVTGDGIVEAREALALPARPDRAVMLRRVLVREGTATIEVTLDLRAHFGTVVPEDLRRDDAGTWRGRAGNVAFAWTGGAGARVDDATGALTVSLALDAGAAHDFVLVLDTTDPGAPEDPDALWDATDAAWGERVPDEIACPSGTRDARHACAVLSGLTSTSGAMVAAATTGLPERAQAGRSYDYRYAWIRDQCYVGLAGARAGVDRLLDDAVRFVGARLREHGPGLRPAYTVTGGDLPDERRLPLPGYPGGDAIVGNHVNRQFQLDPLGEALLLFAAAARAGRLADPAAAAAGFRTHWRAYAVVEIDRALAESAADLAARHALRAHDAVQLAAGLVAASAPAVVRFATFDQALARAAAAEGLQPGV